jgi:YVTN family beta-propeller protein
MVRQDFVRLIAASLLLAPWSFGPSQGTRASEPGTPALRAQRHRRPVALVCGADGKTLMIANQRSGSVSIVDSAARRIIAECEIGHSLADLATLPGERHSLAVDQVANDVMLLSCRDRSIQVVDRLKVALDPIKVVVSVDGGSCTVASRWSRRLTFVGLVRRKSPDACPTLSISGGLDLPFCPRDMAMLGDGSRLVVAEAFGGRLAVVDVRRRLIESVRTLPGHNIRGLALAHDGQTLLIAHQVLSRLAHSSFDDVHWGLLVRNHLRVLQTKALLQPGSDAALLEGSRLFDLGDVGYAAGDPSAVTLDVHGNLIVALAGVDEIAITPSPEQAPRRTVVGRRPTALATSPDGSVVYVADTLDDTISIVDIKNGQRLASIALGPRPDLTAAERGERLFYSAKLSHDGWMSCHSCHTDGHTNNLLSDTLGDGSYGAPKRVPSLLAVANTGPWTWTGSMARLEDQIRKSIKTTMHGPEATQEQVTDLTAYLNSLAPPQPVTTGNGRRDLQAVARGRKVFEVQKCATCHVQPEYTSPENYDVGLVDEVGNHQFNPPSLRGVSQRDALLHDGRARSLDDVFRKLRHPRDLVLSPEEIADLAAFLGTL